jgi:hypothetical protein
MNKIQATIITLLFTVPEFAFMCLRWIWVNNEIPYPSSVRTVDLKQNIDKKELETMSFIERMNNKLLE